MTDDNESYHADEGEKRPPNVDTLLSSGRPPAPQPSGSAVTDVDTGKSSPPVTVVAPNPDEPSAPGPSEWANHRHRDVTNRRYGPMRGLAVTVLDPWGYVEIDGIVQFARLADGEFSLPYDVVLVTTNLNGDMTS